MSNTITEILMAFGSSSGEACVSRDRVLGWMKDDNLEVRAALYQMIVDRKRGSRVQPPLTFDDYFGFVVPFLVQCIKEDCEGEWTENRSLSGHSLKNWFVGLWDDEAVPREKLYKLKLLLETLYKEGDTSTRDVVVNSILEHLFERHDMREFFADWAHDSGLAEAHRDALLWAG
jgi:hypothetical protein